MDLKQAAAFAESIERMRTRFCDEVYMRGLYTIIHASKNRGMSGQFGATTLASWEMAGRIMLTFSRAGGGFDLPR